MDTAKVDCNCIENKKTAKISIKKKIKSKCTSHKLTKFY